MAVPHASVVSISYEEILADTTPPSMCTRLSNAYGYDGPGLLVVTGVPGFVEARAACLPLARTFGTLPEAVRARYERPASYYAFGWSHGKEALEGKYDFAKGSYYANPTYDEPPATPEERAAFPASLDANVWPSEEDCPGFESAFKVLSRLIVDVGRHLARHCDAYVEEQLSRLSSSIAASVVTESHTLARIVTSGHSHKARLLFYFPVAGTPTDEPELSDVSVSSHCGWHNDHGSLTGLTSAVYYDADGIEVPCPDPRAGLYVRARRGDLLRVAIPPDAIAFQIGEAAQIHSGGVLQATPHCVRAPAHAPGVCRATMAVFMQPDHGVDMAQPEGADSALVLRAAQGELLPRGVPTLASRWRGASQSFGAFADASIKAYL